MNSRQKDLVEKLLTEMDYITISQLAKTFEVSNRTIHYDLATIEEFLVEYDVRVDKKRSVGIKITGDSQAINEAMISIGYRVNKNAVANTERLTDIFNCLVIDKEYITIQELSDKFYVSASSIINDLNTIRTILSDSGCVDIVTDRTGSYSEGTERQVQTSINTYQLFVIEKIYGRQFDENDLNAYLSQNYNNQVLDSVIEVISEKCYLDKNPIATHYKINLFNAVNTLVTRIIQGHHMSHVKNKATLNDDIKELETYTLAQESMLELMNQLDFVATEEDIRYLNSILISSGIQMSNINIDDERDIEQFVDSLIKRVGELTNSDLSSDETLRTSLIVHVKPMIYRNKNEIIIKNPLLEEIMKDYAILYSLIFLAIKEIDYKDLQNLSRDEISFLLVYFQASLERNVKIKKVLLVCPNGIGSTELLMFRLKRYLPPLDIVEISSIERLEELNLEDFDFIISTITLNVVGIDVIKVSPLLTDEELKKINTYYLEEFSTDGREFLYDEDSTLQKYLSKENIYLNTDFKTSEEVLTFLSKKTFEQDVSKLGFLENVIEREVIEPTSLWSGVAIPHANPLFVKRTRIYILVNKSPIQWGQMKVRLVFLICISEKDLKLSRGIVGGIHKIIGSKDRVDKFIELDAREMIQIVKGKNKDDK